MSKLQGVVSDETMVGTDAEDETERLRNFLIYTLALDYKRNKSAVLSSEDREHFTALSNLLNSLRTAHRNTHLHSTERQALAPYFWLYLHEPCKALAVPVECAAQAVLRFTKFQDYLGRYKGSTYGVLHSQGPDTLAYKLGMDRSVLIPRLVADPAVRRDMILGNISIGSMYFKELWAMEGSTMVSTRTQSNGWGEIQSIRYTLNERGEAYNSNRDQAKKTAEQGATLSPAHWASKIKTVTSELLKRLEHFPDGKDVADTSGTWKDAWQPEPPGTHQDSHLWQRPYGWLQKRSTHLTDFFEHRAFGGCCDT